MKQQGKVTNVEPYEAKARSNYALSRLVAHFSGLPISDDSRRASSLRRRTTETLILLLILALAVCLRLTNLSDNPGWYTDETTHVDIARHLLHGRAQYLAITQSMMLVGRPPLFHLLLAGLFGAFGEDIGILRALTGVLGIISAGLLYLVVRRATGERVLSLLAALMLAIYPNAVLYSRFGFSYNLLSPLVLLMLWGMGEYLRTPPSNPPPVNREGEKQSCNKRGKRWLALAALAVGVGSVSDLLMMTFAAPFVLVVLARRWRDLLWSLPLMALPFGIYGVVMLASVPRAFLFDVQFTLSRLGAIPLEDQLPNVALNYTVLISQDFWMLAGIIGLFLLRPVRLQRLSLLLFLLPLVLLGRTAALYSLSFYYMIALLPLVALGAAALVRYGAPYVFRTVCTSLESVAARRAGDAVSLQRRLAMMGAGGVALLVVASPLLTSTVLMNQQIVSHWNTAIEPFLINAADARQAARYVNRHTNAGDLVIGSPPVAWLFDAHAADFQMAVAATGEGTVHFPPDVPADRFAFDPRYMRARFVVVDNLWRNWGAVHIPGVLRMLREVETWPLVFQAGAIEVYRNPDG
jgi:4-amino-4-deoxy-L-arabinose transferase-like glycosyltransferase